MFYNIWLLYVRHIIVRSPCKTCIAWHISIQNEEKYMIFTTFALVQNSAQSWINLFAYSLCVMATIEIICNIDHNFVKYCGVMLTSLLKITEMNNFIYIYLPQTSIKSPTHTQRYNWTKVQTATDIPLHRRRTSCKSSCDCSGKPYYRRYIYTVFHDASSITRHAQSLVSRLRYNSIRQHTSSMGYWHIRLCACCSRRSDR